MLPFFVQQNPARLRILEVAIGASDLNLIVHSLLVRFKVVRRCGLVAANITEKAHTFVNLSRVKSHHLLCPGFGFAFIARVFCHIVFAFHMFLQSLFGGAPVLTL